MQKLHSLFGEASSRLPSLYHVVVWWSWADLCNAASLRDWDGRTENRATTDRRLCSSQKLGPYAQQL